MSVDYATSDGTAAAGEDYTEASGKLTFEVGEITKTVSVQVLDDAHDDDGETFTLTLSNPLGGDAYLVNDSATGTIENSDPMPKAWITRFGRTVSDHVVDAIHARLSDGPREAHLTLGGLRVDNFFAQRPADANRLAGGPGGFLGGNFLDGANAPHGQWDSSDSAFESRSFPGNGFAGGNWTQTASRGAEDSANRLPNLKQLLIGSSFFYSSADGGQDANKQGLDRLKGWSAWGRMAETRFRGEDGPLVLDGEVATGMLGVDVSRNRWLVGVVLAHSDGEGDFAHETAIGGSVTSTLISMHPFAQYRINERTSVWGMIGYGVGDLSLTPEGADTSVDTDLRTATAALGGRGVLSMRTGASGSFKLAVRSDVMLTETQSGASENLLSATGATSLLRVILEGSGLDATRRRWATDTDA